MQIEKINCQSSSESKIFAKCLNEIQIAPRTKHEVEGRSRTKVWEKSIRNRFSFWLFALLPSYFYITFAQRIFVNDDWVIQCTWDERLIRAYFSIRFLCWHQVIFSRDDQWAVEKKLMTWTDGLLSYLVSYDGWLILVSKSSSCRYLLFSMVKWKAVLKSNRNSVNLQNLLMKFCRNVLASDGLGKLRNPCLDGKVYSILNRKISKCWLFTSWFFNIYVTLACIDMSHSALELSNKFFKQYVFM